jgi:hypothetical protein
VTDFTQYHVQRLGTLRSDRSNWEQQWEEAAQRVLPAHATMFTSAGANQMQGQKKTELQFDGTTAQAAQKFMAVMESLATPQNAIWHLLKVMDKTLKNNRAVRRFFDDLSDTLYDYRYRPAANFVGNSQQVYLSLGVYGNGSLFIDSPEKSKGLRYRNMFLGETYWVENHAGIVDTVYRSFRLSPRQVVQRYGRASETVMARLKQPTQADVANVELLHVVSPNEEHNPGIIIGPHSFPFSSITIEVGEKLLLKHGGFDSFPYAVSRYTQVSGETYGRGPAQWVLPSIKTLNEQKKTVLKQGHRVVDPTLLAYDDGKLASQSLRAGKMVAGGVSKEGRMLVQPLPTGNIAVGDKMMEMERVVIQDGFLINLFQILVETPTMTATEVLERAREKGMLLAPTAGRMQAEFLGPMIEREITLLARQGLLPQLPPILRDAAIEYKVEYDNPMSRMARAERAAGFMRALGNAAEYAKMTNDVEPLDFFNFDAAMPAILDIHGAPIAWTRSPEEVEARRAGRAQAAEQQQMIEAAPSMAALMKAGTAGKGQAPA